VGFLTGISVCIGCKACEVACKEWNLVPDDGLDLWGMSPDKTGMLGANSWRHLAFIGLIVLGYLLLADPAAPVSILAPS